MKKSKLIELLKKERSELIGALYDLKVRAARAGINTKMADDVLTKIDTKDERKMQNEIAIAAMLIRVAATLIDDYLRDTPINYSEIGCNGVCLAEDLRISADQLEDIVGKLMNIDVYQ